MKKQLPFLKKTVWFLFVFFTALNLNAQTEKTNPMDLVIQNVQAIGLSANDLKNVRISDAYTDKLSGATIIYLQQTYMGIDVLNAVQTIAIKNGMLMSLSGSRIDKIELKANSKDAKASLSASDAVRASAKHLNLPAPSFINVLKESADKTETEFGDLGISSVNIRSKLLWFTDTAGAVKLCWQVGIQPKKQNDYWLIHVDALQGIVINKMNLNVSCQWVAPKNKYGLQQTTEQGMLNAEDGEYSIDAINSAKYRVIGFPVESPEHPGGTPSVQTNPWILAGTNNAAATLKWNDDGNTVYDSTRGNNVLAQEDTNGNNGLGYGAHSTTGSTDLTFDFAPDFTRQPLVTVNQNFALTNLFYWNNIMHDISYQYGFDEAAGNFQANNLSRGGEGNDYVFADAQDGSGINNANFATPSDGFNPRMQMYLFDGIPSLVVNTPGSFAGQKQSAESVFSTKNKIADVGPVSGNLVLYNDDATGSTHGGCVVAANPTALLGKIALIKRGSCSFTVKVKNAETAGAIAVIVWDSIPGENPIPMGGTDNTIKIPAFMVTKAVGDSMMNLLHGGTAITVTMASIKLDGDLDNGVISHEYTHGISNRLTGGPSQAGCLQNKEQMGEGWSDYMAIMVTTNWNTATVNDGTNAHPIGNYVIGAPVYGPGIRTYPYSTDVVIDPWTYDMLATNTGGEVHTVGEIWTTVLWDMTWNIIQHDGINKNIYNANGAGGNSVAIKLVLEGLKLQRCSPGFLDGRDAILKADTLLYGGKYSCFIWSAFAKRGMGIGASEGSSDNYKDQVADFNVPAAAIVFKTANKDSALQLETIEYKLKAKCQCASIANYKLVDTLPANITYVSGGTYNSADRTVTFTNINLSSQDSASFTFVAKVNSGTYSAPVTLLNEPVSNGLISPAWTTTTNILTWQVKSTQHHSGSFSFFVKDTAIVASAKLTTTAEYKLKGISTLSFWHYFNTEGGFDGGWVEISKDNGVNWVDIAPYIKKNGYQSNIATATKGVSGPGFSGYSGGFIQTVADLSSFAGDSIKIRFNYSSDNGTGIDGWYLDDILLTSQAGVYNLAKLFSPVNVFKSQSNANTIIKDGTLPVTWGSFTATKQGNTALLKWQTLQEVNTAKFIIERSTDGTNFYTLGSVTAAGNASTQTNYQSIDALPLNGDDLYRIAQVDKDGQTTYSPIRPLQFLLGQVITITPNPAKDRINVTVTGNDKPLKIYLLTATGQQVSTFSMKGQYLQINLPNAASGIYYIKITGEGINHTQKLVIQ